MEIIILFIAIYFLSIRKKRQEFIKKHIFELEQKRKEIKVAVKKYKETPKVDLFRLFIEK